MILGGLTIFYDIATVNMRTAVGERKTVSTATFPKKGAFEKNCIQKLVFKKMSTYCGKPFPLCFF